MTTYEQILAWKPESILDVVPRSIFREIDDPDHGAYIKGGNCYEWKYAVAKWLQPESILEIGVRFGYSLCSFIMASDALKYVEGWDPEIYEPGSNEVANSAFRFLPKVIESLLWHVNSMQVDILGKPFDLVHIDGSHNYDNCLHDLNLCKGKARAILIDDVDGCDDDKRACRDFIAMNPELIQEVLHLPSHTGDLLILLKTSSVASSQN